MESLDYDFAIQKYTKNDFRYKFVKRYIEYVKNTYKIDIFNCKIKRPKPDSKFLNFYIYLWEDDPAISYRIEDPLHFYITSFYKILDRYPLPQISKDLHIQFFQKNIKHVMYGKILDLTWHDIHESISGIFPQVANMSCWSAFYIFIKTEDFQLVVENTLLLSQIKKYCFEMAKKNDTHGILSFEEFYIRVDDYENYHSIGGYNYFNSDYMFDCLKY